MEPGDLVVVPHGPSFYVAKVTGPATYNTDKVSEDTAHRRRVEWLNGKHPLKRKFAKTALISRLKSQGSCTPATDILTDIQDALAIAESGTKPTFRQDIKQRLIAETLEEMRSGRIDSYGFEELIRAVLDALGAKEAVVTARNQDKGADVIATFMVAGVFPQKVAVQAKHWKAKPAAGVQVVEQLIKGIEAEGANHGMIITSGTISEAAADRAEQYHESSGVSIELLGGEEFARLVVEHYATLGKA